MFVSDNWICFQSKVFGKDTKIAIPVVSVTQIKKTKTAILVPNALVISTSRDRYVFVSFLSRENTYKFLMSVCLHLEEHSPSSSPFPSVDNSFRVQRSPPSPHFPLGFTADFSELGVARDDMEGSSSSDCPTPDYHKIAEFPVPTLLEVLKQADDPDSLDQETQQSPALQAAEPCSGSCKASDRSMEQPTNHKTVSINTLLIIYMLLHQYLGGPVEVNTELYSELTLNLMKLEKVQRNLQRLLDEAAA
ncbi:hypothetical protein CRUP_018100 [Coryphaenoides rupestris]|nr:hypothetical protein CRUP_018100 [Coryphaenoides rupestris]